MNARITWSPGEARALRETAARVAVLVIGSLNIDLILTADAEPPDEGSVLVRDSSIRAGGHAGNCASALAALGVSVTLLAAVGTDADGDALLDDLRGRGVDVTGVRRDPRAATGRVVIPVFGEKHYMLCLRGANDLYTASDVRAALASGRASYDAVMMFDPSPASCGRSAGSPARCRAPRCSAGHPVASTPATPWRRGSCRTATWCSPTARSATRCAVRRLQGLQDLQSPPRIPCRRGPPCPRSAGRSGRRWS